jgi:hypothetical protein
MLRCVATLVNAYIEGSGPGYTLSSEISHAPGMAAAASFEDAQCRTTTSPSPCRVPRLNQPGCPTIRGRVALRRDPPSPLRGFGVTGITGWHEEVHLRCSAASARQTSHDRDALARLAVARDSRPLISTRFLRTFWTRRRRCDNLAWALQ